MNKNIKMIEDNPKLLNYYGDYFDYKNNFGEGTISTRLHSKKLNAEREIKKARIQKKLDKLNLISIKDNSSIEKKFKKSSLKMEFSNEINQLRAKQKSLNTKLDLSDFILCEIKEIKKDLKRNFLSTKKTINSLKTTGDSPEVIENKINELYLFAQKKELKLEKLLIFFKEYNKIVKKTNPNNYNSLQEYSFPDNVLYTGKNNNEKLNELLISSINKKINNSFFAYNSQHFFSLSEDDKLKNRIDTIKQKEYLRKKYKEEKSKIKKEIVNALRKEKSSIYEKARFDIQKSKENYKFSKKSLIEVNDEFKKLNKTEELIHIENNQKIKNLTKQNKKEFTFIKKEFKKNYVKEKSVNLGFKLFIANPILFLEFKNNTYRSKINELKAKNKLLLGNQLKSLTFNGDYIEATSKAKINFIKYNSEIKNEFINNYSKSLNNFDSIPQSTLETDKLLKKEEISSRIQQFKILKNKIIERYKNKEISKEAKRAAILKEKIFLKEDIRVLKMGTEISKAKFSITESLVSYSKERRMNKNNYLQNINNISRSTPIEVKKNISFWFLLLGFFCPGADAILLKNWKKGILLLLLTILTFSVFIPYGFGAYNIQGKGIIGLIQLSWLTETDPFYGDKFSDSRYALVEGVIGLLLLIFSFIYLFSNSIMTFKIVKGMESGIRQNTWMETKKTLKSQGFPYAISLPGWILISFIVIMPIIVSILLAFTNIGTNHEPGAGEETNWVGFDNFVKLFTNSAFFEPLANVFMWNIVWAFSTTFLVVVIGTIMAVIIENKQIKGKKAWRLIFMLPWAIPAFVSILFYKVIFDSSSSGFINSVLIDWGITTSGIDWMKDQTMSRMILILIQGWLGHSYILLLVTGNMKSISEDVYEAASIDGAKKNQQFWKITMPIILIQIAPLLIVQFTFNFNNFSLIWLFNDGGGKINPDYLYDVRSCDILLSWIFRMTFGGGGNTIESNQAIASSLVVLMSIVIVSAAGIGFSRTKAFKKGGAI